MGSSRWLLDFHLRHPLKFTYILVMPIIEVFLFLYPVSITANVIQAVIDGRLQNLTGTLVFLLFFAIFQASIFFSLNFVNEILAHRVTTDITYELFTSVQSKSLSYHDGKDIGQIMARATGDTRTVNKALSPGISRMLALATGWVLAFIISAVMNPYFILITLISLIIYSFSVIQFTRHRIGYSTNVLVDFSNLSEFSLRSVSGIKEIKGFNAEVDTIDKFGALNTRFKQSQTIEGERGAFYYPALIVTLYAAGMIATSVYLAFIGQLSFSDVVIVTGVILFLQNMSSHQQWQFLQIIGAIAAIKRLYYLINEEDMQKISHGALDLEGRHASIEFKNVAFRYSPNTQLVFDNISFRIDDNQTIAIVGGPGSGKSTITKLIQRLYLPEKGEILIGGNPIQEYTNDSLRRFIATVEQDVFLFNKSITDNIRFGKPSATFDEIQEVTRIAHAHDFISQFPDGYDTIIGERGVRLSGGQAQRISIARALLVNPSILLMDDGVSALDAKTEIEIQNAISDILKTRTTVITTHRLSIIAKSDLVLVLDDHQLVGAGTHGELIRTNEYYRRLFEFHYELPPLEVSK